MANMSESEQTEAFELQAFLPYRLAVLTDAVSQSVADLYRSRCNLSRAEWRILAALGDKPDMASKDLCNYTTLDKMQVSRAVTRLEANGHLHRQENSQDRRNKLLRLSDAGEALLAQIIPLAKEREAFLLSALSEEEQKAYSQMSQKIYHQAQKLLTPTRDDA
jgi:DNA-binding MarR family transcriptional regulator